MTNKEYEKLCEGFTPKSKSYKNIPLAFIIGGSICAFGQFLVESYVNMGVKEDMAYTGASLTLVLISAVLTGFNVFDDVAKHAGAGTLVPITGFANAITSPALEFKKEGYILGMAAKMFIIAGPVIVYGTSASVIYGFIIFLFGLY